MFSKPKIPAMVPPPNPATMADPSIASAAAQARMQMTGGLPSTVATSPLGDTSTPTLTNKRLTGQ